MLQFKALFQTCQDFKLKAWRDIVPPGTGRQEFYKRAAEMFELADHSESNFSKPYAQSERCFTPSSMPLFCPRCNLKYAEFAAKASQMHADKPLLALNIKWKRKRHDTQEALQELSKKLCAMLPGWRPAGGHPDI